VRPEGAVASAVYRSKALVYDELGEASTADEHRAQAKAIEAFITSSSVD
jgi:hypothetical protein